jgi:hypothetical protein
VTFQLCTDRDISTWLQHYRLAVTFREEAVMDYV